jgi:hypothetical protein
MKNRGTKTLQEKEIIHLKRGLSLLTTEKEATNSTVKQKKNINLKK